VVVASVAVAVAVVSVAVVSVAVVSVAVVSVAGVCMPVAGLGTAGRFAVVVWMLVHRNCSASVADARTVPVEGSPGSVRGALPAREYGARLHERRAACLPHIPPCACAVPLGAAAIYPRCDIVWWNGWRRQHVTRRWALLVCAILVAGACGSGGVDTQDESESEDPAPVADGAGVSSVVASSTANAADDGVAESEEASEIDPSPGEGDGGIVDADEGADDVQACAEVIAATADSSGDGTYRFSATVRSGDTGWDKYADAWEVRSRDGEVLGVRELAHPHETEQPFTRSLSGVEIPDGTTEVVLAARDSVNGFCGAEYTLALEG
jgi:hypothetical protein